MVIMNKTGLGGVGMVIALSLVPVASGCGFGLDSARQPAPSSSESAPANAAADQTAEEAASTGARVAKSRAGLVDTLRAGGNDRDDTASITAEGTDSVPADAVAPVDAEIRLRLARFGESYLGFDYREPPERRLDELIQMVTPSLFTELAAPLPMALTETLVAERRVEIPELLTLVPVEAIATGGGVYELSFAVAETTTPDGTTVAERERMQTITVVLNADNLVEDVR